MGPRPERGLGGERRERILMAVVTPRSYPPFPTPYYLSIPWTYANKIAVWGGRSRVTLKKDTLLTSTFPGLSGCTFP